MKDYEVLLETMESEGWVVRKNLSPYNSNLPKIITARPVVAVATDGIVSTYVIIHLTNVDKELYCFYDVAVDMKAEEDSKKILFSIPHIIPAEDITSAIKKFNHFYTDDNFLEISPITRVDTKYCDTITFNEDGEHFVSYGYGWDNASLVEVANEVAKKNWIVPFHPLLFGNLDVRDASNRAFAVCKTDTGNFVAVTGLELREVNLVCNVLLITPFGLATDICVIPNACDSVQLIIDTYNDLESDKFGKIVDVLMKADMVMEDN